MQAWTGGVLVAAALLVLAGVPKIARPAPTTAALRSVGVTFATRTQVRLLAVAEVIIGVAALLRGGIVVDALVAVIYVGFSVFLVRALRPSSATVSCGCTGRADTPPTYAHLVLTVTLAVLATVAALAGGHTGLTELGWADDGAAAALVVGFSALGTWLGWTVLTRLPDLLLLRPARAET